MFYTPSFWYKTFQKSLPQAPDVDVDVEVNDCVLVLVQVEAEDIDKRKKVTDKLLKNLKWLAGKFESKKVVLHFFSHLSESRSSPEFAREVLEDASNRLISSGYEVHLTPFGYFCEMKLHIGGESLAKVFKSF
jgi:hypothetical protein